MKLISLPSRFGFEGTINWFPGHMAKATKRISQTLNLVTTIIELRDARIPVSSSNPILKDVIGTKRRIVVLNKSDLCNMNITNIHVKKLRNEAGISGVQLMDARNISAKNRIQLREASTSESTMKQVWLVCGMPNVGKSTFINSLIQKGRKAPVSGTPGWTRGQTLYQLEEENVLLLDTPGVLVPGNKLDPSHALNLALCGSIEDKMVPGGSPLVADYLLYVLNSRKGGREKYLKSYEIEIPDPTEIQIWQHIFPFICKRIGKEDHETAAQHFLGLFRKGLLGKYTLDPIE